MSERSQSEQMTDNWFEEWFRSDFYLKMYSHRDKAEAEACVDLIVRATGLNPEAVPVPHALDLACGPGRHALSLAEHGFRVTAVDLSPTLLEYARSEADQLGVDIDFIQSDMRHVVYSHQFDLVVQLFTSFGYFDDPADDHHVLHEVRNALLTDGYYALDLLNERHLRQHLVAHSEKHYHGQTIREERHFEGDRVVKTISIPVDGDIQHFRESVRLFSRDEIEEMLIEAGLHPFRWFGDYAGSDYDEELSPRMFVMCRAV
jgi:SAM-dependent methyltransferase